MDGGGLSSGGRFRIGGLWRRNNNTTSSNNNTTSSNNNTTSSNNNTTTRDDNTTASGRKAAVWGNEHDGVGL